MSDCDSDDYWLYDEEAGDGVSEYDSEDDSGDGRQSSLKMDVLPIRNSSSGCPLTVAHLVAGRMKGSVRPTTSLVDLGIHPPCPDDVDDMTDVPLSASVETCTYCSAPLYSHMLGPTDDVTLRQICDFYYQRSPSVLDARLTVTKCWLDREVDRRNREAKKKAENTRKKANRRKKRGAMKANESKEAEEPQNICEDDAVGAQVCPLLGGVSDEDAIGVSDSEAQEKGNIFTKNQVSRVASYSSPKGAQCVLTSRGSVVS